MTGCRNRRVALGTFCLLSGLACAGLPVIYDSGATQPLAPFLDVFAPPPAAPVVQSGLDTGAADVSHLLPIRSPELTPGVEPRHTLSLPNNGTLPRPLFLIGSDARSRIWLIRHRDRLKSIGAVGMLVQAESVADLQTIARIAEGLPILPAAASDIARALGIHHIPVLISARGIEP